jgi:hypothetical protein
MEEFAAYERELLLEDLSRCYAWETLEVGVDPYL